MSANVATKRNRQPNTLTQTQLPPMLIIKIWTFISLILSRVMFNIWKEILPLKKNKK